MRVCMPPPNPAVFSTISQEEMRGQPKASLRIPPPDSDAEQLLILQCCMVGLLSMIRIPPPPVATLPSVKPLGSSLVEVSLDATEMTADKLVVTFRDQDGEWGNLNLSLDVPTHTTDTIMDFLDADIDETSLRATRFKKGTATIVADKDIGDSFLPPNVKVTLREHV